MDSKPKDNHWQSRMAAIEGRPELEPEDDLIECPFCGEDDFDLIGLKNHLQRYCYKFDKTPSA